MMQITKPFFRGCVREIWAASTKGWFRVNVDAFFMEGDVVICVEKDCGERVAVGEALIMLVVMVKAQTVVEGVIAIRCRGRRKVIIEGDANVWGLR